MQYARCRICRSELCRLESNKNWEHIHRVINSHIPEPDTGSVLNVRKIEDESKG